MKIINIISALIAFTFFLTNANAQDVSLKTLEEKLEAQSEEIKYLNTQLNNEAHELREKVEDYAPMSLVLILFGALWAQNTGRNPWLWFFGGALFNFIAVLILLRNNADDILTKRLKN